MTQKTTLRYASLTFAAGALSLAASAASADQVIADDLIVQSSLCVGTDCNNGESFGFDTIRLKENNVRIKFDDTSNSGSFPNNDWQLTANDSSNGGANKFSIDDISGGRTPFTIEASAPSHSLYVDDGGRIGLGTSTPVVEVHVVDGDSPTIRLEQDGSSGFTAQTWDLAANETNFFVRDVTNGSRLPFKIRPLAPTNSLYINTDGNIGLGTASPSNQLHINAASGDVVMRMSSSTTDGDAVFKLQNSGTAGIDELRVSMTDTPNVEMKLDEDGNMVLSGTLGIADAVAAPAATFGVARLFVDSADGNLKVIFGDGSVVQIAANP